MREPLSPDRERESEKPVPVIYCDFPIARYAESSEMTCISYLLKSFVPHLECWIWCKRKMRGSREKARGGKRWRRDSSQAGAAEPTQLSYAGTLMVIVFIFCGYPLSVFLSYFDVSTSCAYVVYQLYPARRRHHRDDTSTEHSYGSHPVHDSLFQFIYLFHFLLYHPRGILNENSPITAITKLHE